MLNDLRRPLGVWGTLALTASALAIGTLKLWEVGCCGRLSRVALSDAAAFAALYMLLISMIFSFVAMTRRGTNKVIPIAVVAAVFVLVPSYAVISFVELPVLIAMKVIEFWRLSCFLLALAVSLAVGVWYARKRPASPARQLASWLADEVLRPLDFLATVSGFIMEAASLLLKYVAIVHPLLIFHRPSLRDLLPYLVLAAVILSALIMSARPLWKGEGNRVASIVFLVTLAILLPGPLAIGAYLVVLGIIALLWKLTGLFLAP